MDKDEFRGIVEEVRLNNKRLQDCPGPHDFVLEKGQEPMPLSRRKYRCTRCNGTVDAITLLWYSKGLEHGRKAC